MQGGICDIFIRNPSSPKKLCYFSLFRPVIRDFKYRSSKLRNEYRFRLGLVVTLVIDLKAASESFAGTKFPLLTDADACD
jgi:hypothetical protein